MACSSEVKGFHAVDQFGPHDGVPDIELRLGGGASVEPEDFEELPRDGGALDAVENFSFGFCSRGDEGA